MGQTVDFAAGSWIVRQTPSPEAHASACFSGFV